MARSKNNAFRPQVEAFEDRLALSTLNVNGNLVYNANAGVTNGLTITRVANGNFRFTDTEDITVTGNLAGVAGSGTRAVVIPAASVTGTITAALRDGNDQMRLNSTNRAVVANMGNGNDKFSVGFGTISAGVAVHGDGGQDWLDYADWISGVTATVNGSGTRVSQMTGMENIRGGVGNDTLTGDGLANILNGNSGNDTLVGLGGADLLIGNMGADTLIGGAGSDLLIAGTTVHVTLDAQELIHREWRRTDVNFGTRVMHLRNGDGLNGAVRLNSSTVTNQDGASDSLSGGSELDWFWAQVVAPNVDTIDLVQGVETLNDLGGPPQGG